MPETLIACGGTPPDKAGRGGVLELDLSPHAPADKRVRFEAEAISIPLLDDLPLALADAVEIAAYVYSADRLIRRGSSRESGSIGSEWKRTLRFRIPVRCEPLWNGAEVRDALRTALTFLSEDDFDFEFLQARNPVSVEPFLGFRDPAAQVIRPDQVILFSGGLDSLAGVAEHVLGGGNRAVLVAHQSATTIAGNQNTLADLIADRAGSKQVFYAPVWVRKGKQEPIEHSQRLRSFLFAALGLAYARMFGRNSVSIFENGITSFNLPIAEQVVGTRASRTTHPRVLRLFGQLFSLLLGEEVTFENPFVWNTKSDIVEKIVRNGCADLIGMTTSCATVRSLSISGQQCGSCSQCVERRFAILDAGQEDSEPPYLIDLFTGAHENGRDLAMIEAHVLRARKLATMSFSGFLSNYGQVFRAVSDLPGSPDEVARRIFDLHRRYGASVVRVLDEQLKRHAGFDAILRLPETSLLGMIRAPLGREPAYQDPIESEPKPSVEAKSNSNSVRTARITFTIESGSKAIAFVDGPRLKGVGCNLFLVLLKQFQADRREMKLPSDYAFVSTEALRTELNLTPEGLRQQVWRIRRKLEKDFAEFTGYVIDREDVIQSINWTGYRLNPFLVEADPSQVGRHSEMSRFKCPNVTSRAQNPGSPG